MHLELPEDIAAETTDSIPVPPSLHRRPIPEEKAIRAAIQEVRQAVPTRISEHLEALLQQRSKA